MKRLVILMIILSVSVLPVFAEQSVKSDLIDSAFKKVDALLRSLPSAEPTAVTTPDEVFLPDLRPVSAGSAQYRAVKSKQLAAIRLQEGMEWFRSGKLKLNRSRSAEDQVALEELDCRSYDCANLYLIIDKSSEIQGLLLRKDISADSRNFDTSRLVTTKSQLRGLKETQKTVAERGTYLGNKPGCGYGVCDEDRVNQLEEAFNSDSPPPPPPPPPAPATDRSLKKAIVASASRAISPKLLEGKFYALVIGINNYKNINKLENAANDAKVVAEVLKADYGFETTVLLEEQATRDNIMRSINEIRKKLVENDSFLIYYSGHGEFNKATGTSYWLPVDADHDDTTKWLEAKSVSDQLKLISAKHILIVADSCFSGTITRAATTDLRANTTRENYLNKLFEKPSRVLIASGGNEPVSDGGAGGHSLFADVFLKALRAPFDKIFTAEELMTRHLKESVAGRTEQTPEYKVIRNSGHDGGDFLFVKMDN